VHIYIYIQGVPGGKDNILGGPSIGHSKQNLYINIRPIPNGFRDRTILVVRLGRSVLSFPPALLWEGRSIFWEVIVSVILSQKLYMNMCPIPNGFRDRSILLVWLGRPVLSIPPALLREKRSIFWEVIVSVILSKKLYMNMCPIPNGSEIHPF
jgi:hypothetical protein